MNSARTAFTLVELLVVIAIIGVLGTMLLPGMHGARKKASDAACTNNLRQLAAGVNLYVADNDGQFPLNDAFLPSGVPSGNDAWHRRIFPYLASGKTANDWGVENTLRNSNNSRGWVYACPSSDNPKSAGLFALSYAMNTFLKDKRAVNLNRPGKVVLLMDFYNSYVAIGTRLNLDGRLPVGVLVDGASHVWHGGYVNLAFVDGHTERRKKEDVPDATQDKTFWEGKDN